MLRGSSSREQSPMNGQQQHQPFLPLQILQNRFGSTIKEQHHYIDRDDGLEIAIEAYEEIKEEIIPLAYQCPRHLQQILGSERFTNTWRLLERMKTVSVALVICLNVGVDPPDVSKTQPCARVECWIDHQMLSPSRALESIGNALLEQYSRWQPKARYRLSLDPTVEDVRRLAITLRRSAKDERVLFHYNGHGVPKPTANGEIWVFNRNYTQYIPLSLYDLQKWMGSPSIFVYDCSNAGIIISAFEQFALKHEREYMEQVNSQGINSTTLTAPVSPRNCIQLAACSSTEFLPMNPELPADLFTSCLTTPIKIVLRWFVMQNRGKLAPNITVEMLDKIPGRVNDRRTMLGELNWIFTAITDTIAWNTLHRDLFQKLFRQDLLVASLFRNFLLADRIMRSYDCTPVSQPKLPATHQHPMWQAWDMAVDMCLSQLPGIIEHNKAYVSSSFFEEQLTAFQVWLKYGRDTRKPPEQLPIVLQVLLSQDHRLRALDLLSRFLDLGPWAVTLALYVGIFPYVLRLLQSAARELRPLLVSIWAKILAVDSSCQADLVRESCHKYFLSVLQDPIMMPEHRTGAAFVLASIVHNFKQGQKEAEQGNLISICLEQLDDPEPILRQWLAIALGRVWDHHEPAKWRGARDNAHEKLYELLSDPVPEVRTAAVFALGTFIHASEDNKRSAHAESLDHQISLNLLNAVSEDASPMVRMELVTALQWFVYAFETNFINVIKAEMKAQQQQRTNNNDNPTAMLHRKASKIHASASSPSLDKLGQTKSAVTTTTPTVVSLYGGVYNKIYAGLLQLSTDPFDEVANMTIQLLQFLKYRQHERDTFFLNRSIGDSFTSSPTPQRNKSASQSQLIRSPKDSTTPPPTSSSSVPSSPANGNSFLSSNTATKEDPVKKEHRAKSTVVPPDEKNKTSTSYTTLRRNGRQHASPSSLQHLDLLSTTSPQKQLSETKGTVTTPSSNPSITPLIQKPELSTEFVEWSSTYFSNQLMKSEDCSLEPDVESQTHWDKDWLCQRNETLRLKAMEQRERLYPMSTSSRSGGKVEDQLSVLRLSDPSTCMTFHPFNHQLAVGSKNSVMIYDVSTGSRVGSVPIHHRQTGVSVSGIEFVNAHEKAMLMAGSDDGSIRIWRDFEHQSPTLVTAWYAMPDLNPNNNVLSSSSSLYKPRSSSLIKHSSSSTVGMKLCWESVNRCLLVGGGDSRTIRLWDAERELQIHEWTTSGTDSTSYVTTISCTSSCPWIYAVGFGDGLIRVLDKRQPHSSRAQQYREHDSAILDLKLRGYIDGTTTPGGMVAGGGDGIIRFYEPRAQSSCRSIRINGSTSTPSYQTLTNSPQQNSFSVSCMSIHERAQVISAWTSNQVCAIHSLLRNGPQINVIKYYDGILGQRLANVKSLIFHPRLLTLAVATKGASNDAAITSFGFRTPS